VSTKSLPFFAVPLDVLRGAEGVVAYGAERVLSARERDALKDRLTWWFLFRTAAITLLLAFSFVLRQSDSDMVVHSALLYVMCALSYGSILGGATWMRRRGTQGIVGLAHTEVFLETVLTSLLVLATGGPESGFLFFFSLTVLGAAAVLDRRGALLVASISAVLYLSVLVLHSFGWLSSGHAVRFATLLPGYTINVGAYYLVAIMGGFLTEQVRVTSERLSAARERVVELEKLQAAVLHSLPLGVLTIDDDDRVVFVNQSAADTLQSTPATLVGERAHDVLPQLPVAPSQQDASFQITLDRHEGARLLEGHAAELLGIDEVKGRVCVFEDVTELRALQNEHRRNLRLATVGRFAAGLAHEVRNPLAAMVGCLDLLATDLAAMEAGDEPERLLKIARREADRLSNLVSVFLTYARPAPPQREVCGLVDLVESVLEAYVMAEGEHEVLIDTPDFDDDQLRALRSFVDPEQLRQVLWNLLQNARQALEGQMGPVPDDRGPPRLQVLLEASDGHAFVHVDDNGPGIPDEAFDQLFAPFFTTRQKGTGLGLAESHQLVVAQGGALYATPSTRGGARFTMRLPLLQEGALVAPSVDAHRKQDDARKQVPVSHPAGQESRFPGRVGDVRKDVD